jgi:hypothetical protein
VAALGTREELSGRTLQLAGKNATLA